MQIVMTTGTRYSFVVSLVVTLAAACGPATAQDFPPDVTRGKAVYERHCLACHGRGGWGDGPDAAALTVPPANFHRFKSFLKSDEELLRTIEHCCLSLSSAIRRVIRGMCWSFRSGR